MVKIGNIEIKNQVALAPMSGITNASFIKICEEMGIGYAITELISAEAIVRNNKKTLNMLNGLDKINIPIAVQIFGSNPKIMSDAAKILYDYYNVKIIDINMGCPVPKVAIRSNSGSALLKDPKRVEEIVKKVVSAVSCPVTVKIRSGWDKENINAIEIAKIVENAGASAITVHPRTRSQGYSGISDWNVIKEVKKEVNIPVIGNGDIKNIDDAKKMLDKTNCDIIMVGRAALGNPYLFKEIVYYLKSNRRLKPLDDIKKIKLCIKHLNYLLEIKDEKVAILEMRTHVSWYLRGMKNSSKIKNEIFKCETYEEMINILNEIIKNYFIC